MTTQDVKVAIIGGGIVGCSVLYALAKLGWTDTVLLERLELTSGSTWHAAGNVTHFGHYTEITQLYVDSLALYLEAEAETGRSVGFHKTGSLRLATTPEELRAYESLVPLYESMGVPYMVVDAAEIAKLNPLVETKGLFGAAYTPADGHVDPSGATHAVAQAARELGSAIFLRCPVIAIGRADDGRWELDTGRGKIRAEHVIMAASFWSRELALQIGLDLPLYAMEHHEVITEPIPELMALDREVPAVRDPVAPSNVRQEGKSLLCGVYEADPVPWATSGIPLDFGQELLVPDLERIEDHLMKVIERMPAFGEAGLKTINNGPLCFPPDGCPLVGPVRSHPNLWLAAGFPVGIGTGGGSAQYLAHWIVNGAPPYPLDVIDPKRYCRPVSPEACLRQMKETYARGYVLPSLK